MSAYPFKAVASWEIKADPLQNRISRAILKGATANPYLLKKSSTSNDAVKTLEVE